MGNIVRRDRKQTVQKEIHRIQKNLPDDLGDVYIEICNYAAQTGELQIIINGWHDDRVSFCFSKDDLLRLYGWLESLLANGKEAPNEFKLGRETASGHEFLLELVPMTITTEAYHSLYWKRGLSLPMSACCIVYAYDMSADRILRSAFCSTEDIIRRMYTTIRNSKGVRLKSKVIEKYFLDKEDIRLEYKGFSTVAKIQHHDLRYYGEFMSPDKKKVEGWGYAADNYPELKTRFEKCVEEIMAHMEWRKRNEAWHQSGVDIKSIECVFNILPEKFRERILKNEYELSLNEKVVGSIYEVPLFYVTKAWDVLLKGDLCGNEFRVEYEPEYDDPVDRTIEEAIAQNDEMKLIWKELMHIDIDSLEVDFSRFDMHLPPHANEDQVGDYFQNVPEGVEEWILGGINSPTTPVSFEHVSSLMEFTAYILMLRNEENTEKACLQN